MNKKLPLAIILGIVGIAYTFTPYKLLTKTLKIGFGLRHNDHVMIGIVALTIAVVAVYALINEYRFKV
ncbi:MAG TPA: hypothetical protein VJB66_03085 [Candidatus Nanoarchaeia archaeon]|nr:hypothetical protein [Candidatus Nanoarchaeia archaeon]